jgi:hypothetical protein
VVAVHEKTAPLQLARKATCKFVTLTPVNANVTDEAPAGAVTENHETRRCDDQKAPHDCNRFGMSSDFGAHRFVNIGSP